MKIKNLAALVLYIRLPSPPPKFLSVSDILVREWCC